MFDKISEWAEGLYRSLINISPAEKWSAAAVLGAAIIIITLERFFPYKKNQKFFRQGWFNDFVFYTFLQSYALGFVFANIVEFIDVQTHIRSEQILGDVPVWMIVAGSLIFHDFYIYWFHRWMHFNKYLWRLHEAHHSPKEVDWLSGSRSHPIEILINQTVEFGILVLLGAPPAALVIKGAVSAIWGMWIHANLDVNTGKLQHIINGPEMHRWHHSDKDPDGWNTNFATKFAFWDWMFNSAYLPGRKKPEYYGISNYFPDNYLLQIVYAFRKFTPEEAEMIEGPTAEK